MNESGERGMRLDEDMRAVIAGQRLCFAATVTADGRPSLSPKGTIRVWDDRHLFFLDLASPRTRANLEAVPWIELNVVDPLSRRGYRFLGTATIHTDGEIYERACGWIAEDEGVEYAADSVILVEVERALPLVSPGYLHVEDETGMRGLWRERRAELEAGFERYLDRRRPRTGEETADGSWDGEGTAPETDHR